MAFTLNSVIHKTWGSRRGREEVRKIPLEVGGFPLEKLGNKPDLPTVSVTGHRRLQVA